MSPEELIFNGLNLGMELDTSVEPKIATRSYQNRQNQVEAFSSSRLRVTTHDGRISGLSGLFFQYQGKDIGLYSSASKIEYALGEPEGRISEFSRDVFRKAFDPPSMVAGFLHQLTAWQYGDSVTVFLTKLDAYEGLAFPDYRFWSISVGDCWIPPFLD